MLISRKGTSMCSTVLQPTQQFMGSTENAGVDRVHASADLTQFMHHQVDIRNVQDRKSATAQSFSPPLITSPQSRVLRDWASSVTLCQAN